jgi:hypothetical protein
MSTEEELKTKLSDLTKKVYQVDVTEQIIPNEDDYWLIFENSDDFNWYTDGVFVYQPDHEGDPDAKYVIVGDSTMFELDAKKTLPIWIRKDYDTIIKKYYPNYCVSDIENPHDPHVTDFVIASCDLF